MPYKPEYIVCRQISNYLRLQYPKAHFHFDLTGLGLTKAQAGMNKAIQDGPGWPDLFIAQPKGEYHGLFIEVKADKTRLYKLNGNYASPHIADQHWRLAELSGEGYKAMFGVGFDDCKKIIDNYLK